jgi:hypothetical protein
MDCEENQDGHGEDIDDEVYMAQGDESQGHDFTEEGDSSDEEDDNDYE